MDVSTNLGMAATDKIANIAMTKINSISVKPLQVFILSLQYT